MSVDKTIRICNKCFNCFPIEEFYVFSDGKIYLLNFCKDCENKKIISEYKANLEKNTIQKVKSQFLGRIRASLKDHNSFYINDVISYLPYTMDDFIFYIENNFEPWMNWSNWGKYISNFWDDNDISTWKWSIDHIIPFSTFEYKFITDDEFKKCWALKNIRPYSSKQNLLDGVRRIRH